MGKAPLDSILPAGVTSSSDTPGQYTVWDSPASPPSIHSGLLREASVGGPVIVGATDPQAAAAETFRTQGGIISEKAGSADSVIIGRGVGAVASNSVAIGRGAVAASSNNVAIGFFASATAVNGVAIAGTASGNSCTAINGTASASGATAVGAGSVCSGINATCVGSSSTASASGATTCGCNITNGGSGTILVGNALDANGLANNVVIASGGLTARTNWAVVHGGTPTNFSAAATPLVVLGGGAMTITHAGNIVLGHGFTSFAANVFAVGGTATNSFIGTVVIGRGDTFTASLGGLTFRCTNGITTANLGMGDLTVIAPLGTGNAAPGRVNLQTGVAGASGAAAQAARTGAAVQSSATAGDTDLLVFDVNNATLARVTVGAANSGGVGFKVLCIPN